MTEIGGMVLYTQNWALLFIALLTPILWLLARALVRRRLPGLAGPKQLLAQAGLTLALSVPLFVAGYWDVWLISRRAQVLCEETGLKVYRTAEAQGFLGSSDIAYWSQHGFDYVEFRSPGTKTTNGFRETLQDGRRVRQETNKFESRYELVFFDEYPDDTAGYVDSHFLRSGNRIVDLHTGEALGELSYYSIYPGWIDARVLGFMGFSWSPWICGKGRDGGSVQGLRGGALFPDDLVNAVLKPSRTQGDRK